MKEYERAVILRLGRLTSGKAKGPGLFFILPCLDKVNVVDLRTVTFDIPPQEVCACTCHVLELNNFTANQARLVEPLYVNAVHKGWF